jgi:hypothetical protein
MMNNFLRIIYSSGWESVKQKEKPGAINLQETGNGCRPFRSIRPQAENRPGAKEKHCNFYHLKNS